MRVLSFVDTDQCDTESARESLALMNRARERGLAPFVVGLYRLPEPPGATPLGEACDARSIPFRLLRQRRPLDFSILVQLEVLFSHHDPDVFVSHDFKGLALYRMARFRPRTWAALFRGPTFERPPRPDLPEPPRWAMRALQRLERSGLRRADELVAVGPTAAAWLDARLGARASDSPSVFHAPGADSDDANASWRDDLLERLERTARDRARPRVSRSFFSR